jgi:hypothetical protein
MSPEQSAATEILCQATTLKNVLPMRPVRSSGSKTKRAGVVRPTTSLPSTSHAPVAASSVLRGRETCAVILSGQHRLRLLEQGPEDSI